MINFTEAEKMRVRIKRLSEKAKIPTYGTDFSAGADLYSIEGGDVTIGAHQTVMVPLGFAIEIPEGYAGLVFARSGLASKRGIAPANKVGVIDSDYRGECMVALHNHTDSDVTVEGGERVAQLVIVPYLKAEFEDADELSDTERGGGGFGSTGRK